MAVPAATPGAIAKGGLRDPFAWVLAALYAAVFFVLGAVRYAGHRNFVDLGIFAQTAASAFGCFCNTVEGSHWAFHFSPVLYIAGALMLLWRSALALVALQAVAGALTIPPIAAIVARHTDLRAARLCAIVVALYAPLAGLVFGDFHENGLAPAAVAWLFWAFDGGYLLGAALLLFAVLCIKEDQAVFVAAAGVLGFLRYRGTARGAFALGAAFAGAVVAYEFFAVIQPHAAVHSHWAPVRFYDWTALDVHLLLTQGLLQRAGFVLLAFAPLLFLPFRSRAILVAVLPLAEVLASRMPTTYTMGSHYAGAWAGYVLYAFACAIRPIYARDPQAAYRALYWCIALCIAEFAFADPLHPGYFLRPPQARDASLERFIHTLPAKMDVATQEEAYTHLAATDPNAAVLPSRPGGRIDACYVLIDRAYPHSPRLVESGAHLRRLTAMRVYVAVRRDGPIVLYRRGSCASRSPSASAPTSGHSASIATVRCRAAHGDQRARCSVKFAAAKNATTGVPVMPAM